MGPIGEKTPGQRCGYTPEDYSVIFRELNVKRVIRLNEEKYDSCQF